jgi:hypothetical protein
VTTTTTTTTTTNNNNNNNITLILQNERISQKLICLPFKFSVKLAIKVKKARKLQQHSDKPTQMLETIK